MPSSGDGAGICSSFAFKAIHSKCSVGYFVLKRHRRILGTPKMNITSCKKGHYSCPLKTNLNNYELEMENSVC